MPGISTGQMPPVRSIGSPVVYAAFFTPGSDPFSMLALLTPMTLLYGGAIIATAILDKRKSVRERIAAGNGEDLP